ncbi:MAG: hypothetical protein R2706_14440 [Acidimicrobiales bacterium]
MLARYLKGVMGDDAVDLDSYRNQVESLANEAQTAFVTLGVMFG